MPKKSPAKPKPLYRRPAPKPPRSRNLQVAPPERSLKAAATSEFRHPHFLAPSHFTLREDGSIESSAGVPPAPGTGANEDRRDACPTLVFQSDSPFIRLYHGNCLDLLDAIAAKYPEGRFDAIFADPPYFLSNGGITCHAGKMVKVDKGDWDVSRGPELNHEFNREWLLRCQKVLKPNGTIWVTGTHHVIFSIGYALQQLGFKILNDIAWEKPNPPPNLSCRYFTHSTETILWAAKDGKSKHVFNYQEMRKVTGKQMKTVWRKEEFEPRINTDKHGLKQDQTAESPSLSPREERAGREPERGASEEKISVHQCSSVDPSLAGAGEGGRRPGAGFGGELSSIWTLGAPGSDEKTFGKHPTQKPVALVERCLLASTNEGDLVLDPFLGNGTTAVAAIRLKRGCVGVELDLHHVEIAARRVDREIIEIWLRHFRVRMEISVVASGLWANSISGGASVPASRHFPSPQMPDARPENDLAIFPDSINGSRDMAGVPEIQTECIFHECKFVFLSCAHVERGAVVHTTVDVSLQEAWAKTPTGKKRETTHIIRCETEIFRVNRPI